MIRQNPVLYRPLQMFLIEGSAAFFMALLVPGDKGSILITTPLIAGGAAAIAGLGIGLYEKQLIQKEYGTAGPVVARAKPQPKKKKKEKVEEAPAPPPAAIRAFGAPAQRAPAQAEPPVSQRPATAQVSGPSEAPTTQPSPAEPSPAVAGDKLPAWMEKAMAQARMSQEGAGEGEAVAGELSQEQLRARLEQPVELGMPVKATPKQQPAGQAVEDIDSLLGTAAPVSSRGGQIDSLLEVGPTESQTGARASAPADAGSRSIKAAVFHTDPDQRRHIASMLSGIGLAVSVEADSEETALLGLLNENVDVIVTASDVASKSTADYVAKLRKASQFAIIVGYGESGFEGLKEIATVWVPGGPVPADLARMLGF